MTDKQIINALIAHDEQVTRNFFFESCNDFFLIVGNDVVDFKIIIYYFIPTKTAKIIGGKKENDRCVHENVEKLGFSYIAVEMYNGVVIMGNILLIPQKVKHRIKQLWGLESLNF